MLINTNKRVLTSVLSPLTKLSTNIIINTPRFSLATKNGLSNNREMTSSSLIKIKMITIRNKSSLLLFTPNIFQVICYSNWKKVKTLNKKLRRNTLSWIPSIVSTDKIVLKPKYMISITLPSLLLSQSASSLWLITQLNLKWMDILIRLIMRYSLITQIFAWEVPLYVTKFRRPRKYNTMNSMT